MKITNNKPIRYIYIVWVYWMNYMGLCSCKNIDIIPKDREVFTVDDYIKNDIWHIMDKDFVVESEEICLWFLWVMQQRETIIGESLTISMIDADDLATKIDTGAPTMVIIDQHQASIQKCIWTL